MPLIQRGNSESEPFHGKRGFAEKKKMEIRGAVEGCKIIQ